MPERPSSDEVNFLMASSTAVRRLHGMARLAFDDERVYLNGRSRELPAADRDGIALLCRRRSLGRALRASLSDGVFRWLLKNGAFELPDSEKNAA